MCIHLWKATFGECFSKTLPFPKFHSFQFSKLEEKAREYIWGQFNPLFNHCSLTLGCFIWLDEVQSIFPESYKYTGWVASIMCFLGPWWQSLRVSSLFFHPPFHPFQNSKPMQIHYNRPDPLCTQFSSSILQTYLKLCILSPSDIKSRSPFSKNCIFQQRS